MYIDYQARLSNLQSLVSAAASLTSTYILDTIQAGWAADDEVYARFQIGTACAGSAECSVTIAVQIAQDTAFASVISAVSYVTNATTKLVANNIPLVVKLPVAMMSGAMTGDTLYSPSRLPYRYVRALYTLTHALTAGTISCMFVKDTNVTIDRAL